MRLLLDTHALIWAFTEEAKLSRRAAECIADTETTVFVSVVSAWEIAIKTALGKFRSGPFDLKRLPEELERFEFIVLPVQLPHAIAVRDLPRHHDDPFDRLLVAQARCEGLTLVSADRAMGAYGISTLW